jgi:hypothetical protein
MLAIAIFVTWHTIITAALCQAKTSGFGQYNRAINDTFNATKTN